MLSLTKFAAIARQYGVGFRVCFSQDASLAYISADHRAKVGGFVSPIYTALETAGACVIARKGSEGNGLYYKLESLT